MKANDGTPVSVSLAYTAWPSWAMRSALSRSASSSIFERSAPAARMYRLPVTAIASISPRPARSRSPSSTPPSSVRVTGPSVFGRVWSLPLSRVISASVRPLGSGTSRT